MAVYSKVANTAGSLVFIDYANWPIIYKIMNLNGKQIFKGMDWRKYVNQIEEYQKMSFTDIYFE
jgi:hypothetical protein